MTENMGSENASVNVNTGPTPERLPAAVQAGVFGEQAYESAKSLVERLEHIKATSRDYVVRETHLNAHVTSDGLTTSLTGKERFLGLSTTPMRRWAEKQMADRLQVPWKYVELMKQEHKGDLLNENYNSWLNDSSDKRLLRVAEGHVRGYLSSRYLIIDNYDVALKALGAAKECGAVFQRADLDEGHLYLRALDLNTPHVINKDVYFAGIHVRNSDVGGAALTVEPFFWRKACSNGLVYSQGLRKIHLGTEMDVGIFSRETLEADVHVIYMKVGDMVRAALSPDVVERFKDDLETMLGVTLDLEPSIKKLATYGLTESERDSLLSLIFKDETLDNQTRKTPYGLLQGMTSLARDMNSERGFRLMKTAGDFVQDFSAGKLELVEVRA